MQPTPYTTHGPSPGQPPAVLLDHADAIFGGLPGHAGFSAVPRNRSGPADGPVDPFGDLDPASPAPPAWSPPSADPVGDGGQGWIGGMPTAALTVPLIALHETGAPPDDFAARFGWVQSADPARVELAHREEGNDWAWS